MAKRMKRKKKRNPATVRFSEFWIPGDYAELLEEAADEIDAVLELTV